ncbi:hypothetical protein [Bradyrhizobium genosp. A]|uniref:hypothetical protein n=1 Tax=Bradyrhizobium genosp. A TaxID=83626 RepID=UPI003CEBBC2A
MIAPHAVLTGNRTDFRDGTDRGYRGVELMHLVGYSSVAVIEKEQAESPASQIRNNERDYP